MLVMTISWALLLHFLGDFVCQGKWIATKKSSSLGVLSLHVLLYSCWMLFVFLPVEQSITTDQLIKATLSLVGMNAVLHFAIDYFTSKANKYCFDNGNMYGFFCVLGADQYLHSVLLIVLIDWNISRYFGVT